MWIKLISFIFISSSEDTIPLIDNFVGLQLLLNVWKVGNIELLFGPSSRILTMWVEWHPLLLWLQLSRWLVLAVVYVLNYWVRGCCQMICVYCVVDICYVLRRGATVATLRALLVDLKLLLLRWFWLILRGLCLFVLIELLTHDVGGSRSLHWVLCWRRSWVGRLLGLRIELLVRFLRTHKTSVVLALGQRIIQRIHGYNVGSSLKPSLYTWDVGCRVTLRDAIYLLWSKISIRLSFHVIKSRVILSCVRGCRVEVQRRPTVLFTSSRSLLSLRLLLLNYLFWGIHARIDVGNIVERFWLLNYCWELDFLLATVVHLRQYRTQVDQIFQWIRHQSEFVSFLCLTDKLDAWSKCLVGDKVTPSQKALSRVPCKGTWFAKLCYWTVLRI